MNFVLRILFGAVFIFSAITKLLPIEIFELNLVYQELANWQAAPYLSRILVSLELFVGIAFLQPYRLRTFIYPLTFILLFVFTAFLFVDLILHGNNGNCGCFGNIISLTPIESIIKNIILFVWLIFLYRHAVERKLKYKWIFPLGLSVIVAVLFIAFPLTQYKEQPLTKTIGTVAPFKEITNFKGDENARLSQGTKLVALFNPSCSHCQELALQIGILTKNSSLKSTYFLMMGDTNELENFFKNSHTRYPYKFLPLREYLAIAGPWIPRVAIIENGIIKYDWNYKTFNLEALRLACIKEKLLAP